MSEFFIISIDGRKRIIHNDVMMLIDALTAKNEHNRRNAEVALKALEPIMTEGQDRIGVAISAIKGILASK